MRAPTDGDSKSWVSQDVGKGVSYSVSYYHEFTFGEVGLEALVRHLIRGARACSRDPGGGLEAVAVTTADVHRALTAESMCRSH